MLGNYVAVVHEVGWITQSGRDVSEVLQEYRNYIHPQKELLLQASLTPDDARMLWAVFKAIAACLIWPLKPQQPPARSWRTRQAPSPALATLRAVECLR
jgi:hypothetical protein